MQGFFAIVDFLFLIDLSIVTLTFLKCPYIKKKHAQVHCCQTAVYLFCLLLLI